MTKKMQRALSALLLTILLLTGCGGPTDAGFERVDAKQAATMMEEATDYVILDVRTPEEYAEKHIKGAINIPNESIGEQDIAALPDKDQQIFVYCRSGNRSKQASKKLAAMGYSNIVEFGGIKDWNGATETSK